MSEIKAPPAIWYEGKLVSASDFDRGGFEAFITKTSDFTRDQINKVMEAYDFAEEAFKKGKSGDVHRRKTGEPFFDHGKGVFLIDWIEFGQRDIHTLIAELFHDIPEEGKSDLFTIFTKFKERVTWLVGALTNPEKLRIPAIDNAIKQTRFLVMRVDSELSKAKICDRMNNLRTPPCTNSEAPEFAESVIWAQRQLIETMDIIMPLAESLTNKLYKEKLVTEIKNIFRLFSPYFGLLVRALLIQQLKKHLYEDDWQDCVALVQPSSLESVR